jgi:flagellar hook protein FlgE
MASFSIPLTGLDTDSTALNTIANNLSNMNTTAYKQQTTNFSSLFSQQIGTTGSGDEIQQGAGVQVSANVTDFSEGSISATNSATDMAINGNGFFVLNGGNGGGFEYTRAGDFTTDANGNLVTQDGLSVMGYPSTDGVVNTNSQLTAINIPVGQVQAANATSNMSMTANLDPAGGNSFSYQMTIYDSLGEPHEATVTFDPTATANTWSYSVALPASDFASGTSTPVTGTIAFDSSGALTTVTPAGGAAETVGTGAGDVSSISLGFTGLADQAQDLSIGWNLLDSSGNPTITQMDTSAASAVSASSQDGYASGQYESFAINSDGTVTATFSNGEKENVGQIALANVSNLQGLKSVGNQEYETTLASGTAVVAAAGSSGLGQIQDDSLEGSNVNISSEFSELIIAQRAFEADSKAVTTFDQVTQDTMNIIH